MRLGEHREELLVAARGARQGSSSDWRGATSELASARMFQARCASLADLRLQSRPTLR